MSEFLKSHIKFIEEALKKQKKGFDWEALSEYNRVQIGFFQHERLIHLLVTFFFATVLFVCVIAELFIFSFGLLIVGFLLLIMVVFYVFHYYELENGVQKLYRLEKEIKKRSSLKIYIE